MPKTMQNGLTDIPHTYRTTVDKGQDLSAVPVSSYAGQTKKARWNNPTGPFS